MYQQSSELKEADTHTHFFVQKGNNIHSISVSQWHKANTNVQKWKMLTSMIVKRLGKSTIRNSYMVYYSTVLKQNMTLTIRSINNIKPNDPRHVIKFRPLYTNALEPASPSPSPNAQEQCQYDFKIGSYIRNGSIQIEKLIDCGTFGTVMLCKEFISTKTNESRNIALKIIHKDDADEEINILQKMQTYKEFENANIIRFLCTFETTTITKTYQCLVFPVLGKSLYKFSRQNKFHGFLLNHIRIMAHDLFCALKFCHEVVNVTHGDVKPPNILLVNDDSVSIQRYCQCNNTINSTPVCFKNFDSKHMVPLNPKVQLIDFGGATMHENSKKQKHLITTPAYRAPEVMTNDGWHHSADIWSLGCVISELHTGKLLFDSRNDYHHSILIQRFHKENDEQDDSPPSKRRKYNDCQIKPKQDANLCDLINECLRLKPENRISANNALKHPFFDCKTEH